MLKDVLQGLEGIEIKQKRFRFEPEIPAKDAKKDLVSTKYQFPIMAVIRGKVRKLDGRRVKGFFYIIRYNLFC